MRLHEVHKIKLLTSKEFNTPFPKERNGHAHNMSFGGRVLLVLPLLHQNEVSGPALSVLVIASNLSRFIFLIPSTVNSKNTESL